MKQFKAIYYPNSECSPLTLARSVLIFDELIFIDHASITLGNVGTIGHESHMRHYAVPLLEREGYNIRVLEPLGGPVEGDTKQLINIDLKNVKFRKTFFKLLHNDPSFLLSKVPDGNYGENGDAASYRDKILSLSPNEVPTSVEEISSFEFTKNVGMPPSVSVALIMAMDSFNLNLAALQSMDEESELFGDSKGMDMLLKAKFSDLSGKKSVDKGITNAVAYTLLEHLVPIKAFQGKTLADIVRFRNETQEDREKFKEHVLEVTIELVGLSGEEKREKIEEIIYRYLLPEAREFQNRIARNRDLLFKNSLKELTNDSSRIVQEVLSLLPLSITAAILAAATRVGATLVPNLIEYVEERREIDRENPYAYLLKFNS